MDSLPPEKIQQTRYQGPDDARIRRRTQGGQDRDTGVRMDPRRANPPGDDRALSEGQGQQMGELNVTGNGGRHMHVVQGAGTCGRGWRVEGTGDVQVGGASHWEKRWGVGENERDSSMNGYGWGGGWKERKTNDPLNGKIKRWVRRSRLKCNNK